MFRLASLLFPVDQRIIEAFGQLLVRPKSRSGNCSPS